MSIKNIGDSKSQDNEYCAILLIFNSMTHCHDRSMLSRMGYLRAAMGTFSVSSRFRWPYLRICGIHYEIAMKISVSSNMELDKVISQIKLLKNVEKVTRL